MKLCNQGRCVGVIYGASVPESDGLVPSILRHSAPDSSLSAYLGVFRWACSRFANYLSTDLKVWVLPCMILSSLERVSSLGSCNSLGTSDEFWLILVLSETCLPLLVILRMTYNFPFNLTPAINVCTTV